MKNKELWVYLNVFTCTIFTLFKFRHLSRLDLSFYSAGFALQDCLVFLLISSLAIFFLKRLKFFLIPLFSISLINIIFTSKMGYPITPSLLSQVGDLLVLQTSIQAPSIYRNIFIIIFMTLLFMTVLYFKLPRLRGKVFQALLGLLILFYVVSSFHYFSIPSYKKYLGRNILYSLSVSPGEITGFLGFLQERNPSFVPKLWAKKKWVVGEKKQAYKNVVLIVVETLSATHFKERKKEVMPFATGLEASSFVYERHYTPWPFSTKALYSLICGEYPHASSLIEMRIVGSKDCHGWLGQMINELGYRSYAAYTGQLEYDNMGVFLKAQGFKNVRGRSYLERRGEYESTSLSIDDESMIVDFEEWLSKSSSSENFVSVLVTMNSHFPFWAPEHGGKIFKDPYLNAMAYQDQIIEKLVAVLKRRGRYKDTMLIITGDHGRRMNSGESSMLSEDLFKVPLIIHSPWLKGARYHHPTVHNFIGPSVFNLATHFAGEQPVNPHTLESKEPIYLYSDFGNLVVARVSEDAVRLFTGADYKIYSLEEEGSIEACEAGCDKYYDEFHNFLSNNKLMYDF